jgi:hypothetical protein
VSKAQRETERERERERIVEEILFLGFISRVELMVLEIGKTK